MVKTVRDFDFNGKKVLVRTDLDVPMEDGKIRDEFRIKKSLPTLNNIMKQSEQVIIMGHLGRPGGEVNQDLSLKPIADKFSEILDENVAFVDDCTKKDLPDDKVVVLENVRFYKGERENNPRFAKKLASHGEIFVNEAFAVSHREHASTAGVAKLLPGCIGLQFEKELKYLNLEEQDDPKVALMGGAKLSTKIPVIKKLLKKVDRILLGGAMMFTFYKAQGWEIGNSLIEEEYVMDARTLMNNERIKLPGDVVVADGRESEEGEVVSADSIPEDKIGLDIGPKSLQTFKDYLSKANTVIWNGPMGYNENKEFAKATNAIAGYIANLDATTIIGGGDTASVINQLGLENEYTHVSTGGGAALNVLEGDKLPALEALKE